MTRWHQLSCRTPDVFVDGELPRCRACNSVPPLDELIARQAGLDPFLPVPSDESAGQMSLHWPPTVRYFEPPDVETEASPQEENSLDQNQAIDEALCMEAVDDQIQPPDRDTPSSVSEPVNTIPPHDTLMDREQEESSIYDASLGSDRFRLLSLHAVNEQSYPIHISLETFQHDLCPEYETVSYTWGGEQGDSTLCRPVYIGPYWDVLLQTKNCWSMLQHLRPWRGTRMIWVDAICINQLDVVERTSQVANMRAIYQECSKVIVYLGDDLVLNSESPHRHKRGLHELDHTIKDSEISLHKLLQRRYFSRIWVIQELVLPRNALIPIKDVDFWAGNLTPKHMQNLSSPIDWESSAAPWVQYMGSGQMKAKDLYHIFHRTWHSKASDPRDKIFGILGLLQSEFRDPQLKSDAWDMTVLKPDYSISAQHVFIGFFAHILINLSDLSVLLNAPGSAAPSDRLSWLPDWRRPVSWKQCEHLEPSSKKILWDLRQQAVNSVPDTCDITFIHPLGAEYHDPPTSPFEFREKGSSKSHLSPGETVLEKERVESEFSWRSGAFINPATGALNLKLYAVLRFHAAPVLYSSTGRYRTYEIKEQSCALYITVDTPLDERISPGPTWLFYLDPEHGTKGDTTNATRGLLLFVRQLETPRAFRLMICCTCHYLFLTSPRPASAAKQRQFTVDLHESLYSMRAKSLYFLDEGQTLDTVVGHVFEMRGIYRIFPGGPSVRDIVLIMKAIVDINIRKGSEDAVVDAYLACLAKNVNSSPRVNDGFVEMTFSPLRWMKYWRHQFSEDPFSYCGWEWRYDQSSTAAPEDHWKACDYEHDTTWDPVKSVHVRMPIKDLIPELEGSSICSSLYDLEKLVSWVSHSVSEDAETIFTREPCLEDYFVQYQPFSPALQEAFQTFGGSLQFQIS